MMSVTTTAENFVVTVIPESRRAEWWPSSEAELTATAERLGVKLHIIDIESTHSQPPPKQIGTILIVRADPLSWVRSQFGLPGGAILAVQDVVCDDDLSQLDELFIRTVHGRGANSGKWALRFLLASRDLHPQTFAYGTHRLHRADRRSVASDAAAPIAILLHGGFWRRAYERDMVEELAVDLARRGFTSWNLDYCSAETAAFPAIIDDVKNGLAFILDEEARRASCGPVVLVGHSAGAHLALLALATSPDLAKRVRGVWALAAVTDLMQELPGNAERHLWPDGHPSHHERLAASPAHVALPQTSVHLFHGTEDVTVPPVQSSIYYEKLLSANAEAGLSLLTRTKHMDWTKVDSWQWRLVADHLSSLAGCG